MTSSAFPEPNAVYAAWHSSFDAGSLPGMVLAIGKPKRVLQAHSLEEVQALLEQVQACAQEGWKWVGSVSYEAAPAFDPALEVAKPQDVSEPLALFMGFQVQQLKTVSFQEMSQWALPDWQHVLRPWVDQSDSNWFEGTFQQVRHAIEQGEFYQINLTTRLLSRPFKQAVSDPFTLFLTLFKAQPARYSVFMRTPSQHILSLSPELFFSQQGREVMTQPMKGTRRPGGRTQSLNDSEKDLAENVMIVDLLRNDLSRVCEAGSVQVRSLFDVLHLPTVEQMTSSIVGRLKASANLNDIFKALFPCGSVTGAPKRQAMLRIAQWEKSPRGVYCGAVGVVSEGRSQFNVPIRTLAWKNANSHLVYGVGSGLTWYSKAKDEKLEWWQKTQFLRQCTTDFQLLETLKLQDGQWLRLSEHLNRMKSAAAHFAWVWPEQAILARFETLAKVHQKGEFRGRCLLNAQAEVELNIDRMPSPVQDIQLRLASTPIEESGEFLIFKTTWRPHYVRAEQQDRDFDVLLWNKQGEITECCKGNVVLEIEGARFTPAGGDLHTGNLLSGVYRQSLLSNNSVAEKTLTIHSLKTASRMWFINSLRQWVEVARVVDAQDRLVFEKTTNNNRNTK